MHLSLDPWIWIAAILMLFIYSFLYKDNPFYKFAEHLVVGVSVGYGIALFYQQQFLPIVYTPLTTDFKNNWHLIVPLVLSTFFLFRFIPKVSWMIRWPIAITLGYGAGIAIPLIIQTSLYEQIRFTMLPLFGTDAGMWLTVVNLLIILGVISCLTYFYFSIKHTGVIGTVSKIGIVFLMVGFGTSFGNTVMARVSLLIGRTNFLMTDWLGLPIIK